MPQHTTLRRQRITIARRPITTRATTRRDITLPATALVSLTTITKAGTAGPMREARSHERAFFLPPSPVTCAANELGAALGHPGIDASADHSGIGGSPHDAGAEFQRRHQTRNSVVGAIRPARECAGRDGDRLATRQASTAVAIAVGADLIFRRRDCGKNPQADCR